MANYRGYEISEQDGRFHVWLEGNSTADAGEGFASLEEAQAEIDRCEAQRIEDEPCD